MTTKATQSDARLSERVHGDSQGMIERYPKATFEVALGLLHGLGRGFEHLRPKASVLEFFLRVGDENTRYEPTAELRKEARKVLLHRIVPGLHTVSMSSFLAGDVLCFFSSHEKHCDFSGRDLKILHTFLEKWFIKQCHCGVDCRPLEDSFLTALINARYFGFFLDHEVTEAVFPIYVRLAQAMGAFPSPNSSFSYEEMLFVSGLALRQQDAEGQVWWAKDAALALLSLRAISICGRANIHCVH